MHDTADRRATAIRLAAISFLILFLELALIRYVSAYVRVFGFYLNLVLIATFLGMGLGLLRPDDRRWRVLDLLALPLLLGLVKYFSNVVVVAPEGGDEALWGVYFEISDTVRRVGVSSVALILFAACAAVQIPLGAALGREFRKMPPLGAYSADIMGSLVGVLAFALASALRTPPLAWFGVVLAVGIALSPDRRWAALRGAMAIVSIGLVAWTAVPKPEYWSPYYRINAFPSERWTSLHVNGSMHQYAMDLRPGGSGAAAALVSRVRADYAQPFRFAPRLDTVLVVGAGSGNDVAMLLAHGARYVDAVEIDPVILGIGRDRHPQRPYGDPRVHAHVDDARAFLRRAERRYDAIIFGTLDSQTLLSGMSSLRLDNYVYTVESFEAARALLKPDGALIAYHMSPKPFIGAKIFQALATAFGEEPFVIYHADHRLFNFAFVAGGAVPAGAAGGVRPEQLAYLRQPVSATTDDWPYLYIRRPTVPGHYLVVLAGVLALTVLSVGAAAPSIRVGAPDLAMFFLGAGFLLLETKGVTELSLLFGSTWEVNVLVIGSILTVVLLANLLVSRRGLRPDHWIFGGLFAALALAYATPAAALLALPPLSRWGAAAALTALPVLFASLAFSTLLARRGDATRALAFNLIGAIVGGVLEYSSMLFGTKALYLVAGLAYAAAWWAMRHERVAPASAASPALEETRAAA